MWGRCRVSVWRDRGGCRMNPLVGRDGIGPVELFKTRLAQNIQDRN